MEPFVHLHVHTEYSLLDGANRIPDLVQAAAEDEHKAIAITDHGNLFGAIDFYKACRKADVKPILGCEVYIAQQSRKKRHSRAENPYTHLTLLARNSQGWDNLLKLSSIAYLEGFHFRPRIDMEVLNQYAAGITCLSGCMSGPVNRLLRRDEEDEAFRVAGELRDLFGDEYFYLEVMRNGMAEQDKLTEGMVRLQKRIEAPLIATNDIHYLRHEDCNAHDVLLCINTGAKRDDPSRWRMDTDTLFFRTREEMNRIFGDLPEALRNTLTVADQVDVEIELGKHKLPHFEPADGSTADEFFRKLCEAGFAERYPGNPPDGRQRLEAEMKVITEMGFVSYFLIVWDLIRHALDQGIPVGPGRGSAAGSIVAYVLNITRIDPLKYDLLFERFLNSSRISMPDIDIDFCKDRREEMIRYVRERYGDENVCQIITFGKMKARAVLRDVARTLEIPLPEVDQVAKKIPEGPGASLAKAFDADADFAEVAERSQRHYEWLELARKLEGLSRHSSVHAAGVVIADRPLQQLVPLCKQDDTILTQWEMKALEDVGLLKMDFLGLRTLTILEDAELMAETRHGVEIDLDGLPLDDAETYKLLQAADTEGVFQLESGGMRRLLTDLKPDCFEDIIAVLALFRPGPLGSGLVESFVNRKHGREKITYPHSLLEEILQETYGVLVYQEQIMRVAQRMAGFSLNEADTLRKAMGKKKRELMEPFERPFLEGSAANEVPEQIATDIWNMMVKFAEYGFNKSHSTGYALVTYQTAWMKAHYPAEFYAATFTHEAQDTDKLRTLVEDARRHGLAVLPPCVNGSQTRFTVNEAGEIRYGLSAVKGVGEGAAQSLVDRRQEQEQQAYPNVDELLIEGATAGLNKTTFESLSKAGALDTFGTARIDLLASLENRLRQAARTAEDRRIGQGSLFDMGASPATNGAATNGSAEAGEPQARELTDEERKQTLAWEKEALGLFLTQHPLDPYRDVLGGICGWDSRSIKDVSENGEVQLAGIATHVQVRPTRKDPSRKYARLRVEDLFGSTAALVFPNTLGEYQEFIEEDFIGVFHGTVDQSSEEPTLKIDKIEPLADRKNVRLSGSLEIHLPADRTPPVKPLQETLSQYPGSSAVRFIYLDASTGKPIVMRAGSEWSVRLVPALVEALEAILGPGQVKAVAEQRTATVREEPHYRRRKKAESAAN